MQSVRNNPSTFIDMEEDYGIVKHKLEMGTSESGYAASYTCAYRGWGAAMCRTFTSYIDVDFIIVIMYSLKLLYTYNTRYDSGALACMLL